MILNNILFLFKEIKTFINKGGIKVIKSVSNDVYNVTVDFYFK